jgi:hypothetical protein
VPEAPVVPMAPLFAATPDLSARFRLGAPLNRYDRSSFYGGTERGCTGCPAPKTAAEQPGQASLTPMPGREGPGRAFSRSRS